MKVLVFSDSHGDLNMLRKGFDKFKPDAVIHLGDYIDDAYRLAEYCTPIQVYCVKGNCDMYSSDIEERVAVLGGKRIFMCHGHRYHVKTGSEILQDRARSLESDIVLFGHTHRACCRQNGGLWVLNPGSCRGTDATVGILELEYNGIMCYTTTIL